MSCRVEWDHPPLLCISLSGSSTPQLQLLGSSRSRATTLCCSAAAESSPSVPMHRKHPGECLEWMKYVWKIWVIILTKLLSLCSICCGGRGGRVTHSTQTLQHLNNLVTVGSNSAPSCLVWLHTVCEWCAPQCNDSHNVCF